MATGLSTMKNIYKTKISITYSNNVHSTKVTGQVSQWINRLVIVSHVNSSDLGTTKLRQQNIAELVTHIK